MASVRDYVPIELESLNDDLPLSFDLYLNEGRRYLLYRGASSSLLFTLKDCRRLMSSGVTRLWIPIPAEEQTGPKKLMTLLSMPDEHLPPRAKAQLWYGSAKATAQRAMKSSVSKGMLDDVRGVIDATVGFLAHSRSAFPALLSATLHDYSLYTHAVNVAVYALGLGKFVGVTDRNGLRDLGLAAFLHDVGKARVGLEILQKPGPLTPEEWTIMRQHPHWGTELLSELGDLPQTILGVVAQHHERPDGSGYPTGMGSDSLDLLSMVVGLADCFDAMTSARAYKPAFSAYGALSLLKGEMEAGKLDSNLFVSLVLLLGEPSRMGHA